MKTHHNTSPAERSQPRQGRVAQVIGALAAKRKARAAYYDQMSPDGTIPGSLDNILNLRDEIGINGVLKGTFLNPHETYKNKNFKRKEPMAVSKRRPDGSFSRLLDVYFVGESALGFVAHEAKKGGIPDTESLEWVLLPFGRNRQVTGSDRLNETPESVYEVKTAHLPQEHDEHDMRQVVILGRDEIGDPTVSAKNLRFTTSRSGVNTYQDLGSVNRTVHIDGETVSMDNHRSESLENFVSYIQTNPHTWDTASANPWAPAQ